VKVLHVPYSFHPDPVGGTEIYVEALAQQLHQLGFAVVIAAPSNHDNAYEHRGIRVRRYTVNVAGGAVRELYGEGDETAAHSFGRILAVEQPDMLHLHAFTRGVSLRLVRVAKAHGIPVVFTYHTPTVTCQRGTMMQWGTQPCDGLMELHTCARCTLQAMFEAFWNLEKKERGVKCKSAKFLGYLLGSLPPNFGTRVGEFDLQGGHWTALRMTELIELRHATIRSFLTEVDHIVAVCQWVKDTLICNRVPPDQVTLCRQGVTEQSNPSRPKLEELSETLESPLQIAFLGRLDPTKGVHILIQALRSLADAPLRLDIYGMAQGCVGLGYERKLHDLAAADARILFHPPVSAPDVVSTLRDYDLLAAPSQWLETGPLVVLEAFAAGVPVVGSRLGGIAELVRDGFDGILVEPSDVDTWANTLHRLSQNRSILRAMRANVRPPRKMSNVARDMAAIYRNVLAQRSARSQPLQMT